MKNIDIAKLTLLEDFGTSKVYTDAKYFNDFLIKHNFYEVDSETGKIVQLHITHFLKAKDFDITDDQIHSLHERINIDIVTCPYSDEEFDVLYVIGLEGQN
ncbi:MAG: hypothetical protein ACRC0V_10925 [Fusobacteriaceae bacterium]